MATVSTRRQRRPLRSGGGPQSTAKQSAAVRKRRRARALRWFAIASFLLAAVVWSLPMVVGQPLVLNRLAAMALSNRGVRLTFGKASLGWFSPIVLGKIELHDKHNEAVLQIEEIRTRRSLVGLLFNREVVGRCTINRPLLYVRLSDDTTNLEQLLAAATTGDADEADETPDSEGKSRLPHATLVVVNGAVQIVDRNTSQSWTVSQLDSQVVLSSTDLRFNASGHVQDHASHDGRFACQGNVRLAGTAPLKSATLAAATAVNTIAINTLKQADHHPPSSHAHPDQGLNTASWNTSNRGDSIPWDGRIELEAERLPLSLAAAACRRFSPETEMAGYLSSTLRCRWSHAPGQSPRAEVEANIAAERFELAGPFLGNDRLQLARVQVPCRFTRDGERLNIEQLELRSDLAHVAYRGGLLIGADWQQTLTSQTFELTGQIDVARLANALPSTIRVRDDTRITAGQVQLVLRRQQQNETFVIQGQLNADRLAAEHAGRPVVWEQPLRVAFAARHTPRGLAIDNLRCEADFLDLQADGTPEQLQIHGRFDLERLAQELGRFVDLAPLTVDGQGTLQLTLLREADRYTIDGRIDTRGLVIASDSPQSWNDPQLAIRFEAQGKARQWKWQTIDSASLGIEAGSDRLDVALRGPVAIEAENPTWPLALAMQGNLQRWQSRVSPWSNALDSWQLRGDLECRAAIDYDSRHLSVSDSRCRVQGLRLVGSALNIEEPAIEVVLAGRFSPAGSRLAIDRLLLTSTALVVESDALRIEWPHSAPPRAEGSLRCRGDVHRLLAWLPSDEQRDTSQYWGTLQGQLRFTQQEQQTQIDTDLVIEQLVVAWSPEAVWREPRMRLSAATQYDAEADRLQITECQLNSSGLRCTLQGTMEELGGRRLLAIDGQMDYDLDQLAGLIQSLAGSGVRVAGRGRESFSLRGPLATLSPENLASHSPSSLEATAAAGPPALLTRLEAQAAIGWQAADIYGFLVGPGQLRTRLERGMLHIEPLDLAVSHGRLRAAPQVRLSPGPAMLWIEPGQLIEQVRITPAMCAAGLQYIAPVLAGVAEAEGRFSVALSDCRVPISTPRTSEVSGVFTIHDVRIGAGPLVRELALLLDEPGQVRLARESAVRFRMVGGRIYHEGLELVFPEATIRTYGSVGLDQSLALMVEMPVPRKWIGNNPLGDALRRRTIRLPLGGTLSHPRLDRREMDRLAAQFIQEAAGDALREQINRGLNRLFGPPQ